MNVRRYYSALAGNIYEQRGQRLARQLYEGADMRYDYDQFLNKRPRKPNAVFAWHQVRECTVGGLPCEQPGGVASCY